MKEHADLRIGAFVVIVVVALLLAWKCSGSVEVAPDPMGTAQGGTAQAGNAQGGAARGDANETLRTVAATAPVGGERTEVTSSGLQIAGRVVDNEGAAIPGAEVALSLMDGADAAPAVTVGADGAFAFAELVARLYRVTARFEGRECQRLVAAPAEAVECVLAIGDGAAAALTVQVLDRQGSAVANASVRAVGTFVPEGERRGESNERGLCFFPGPACDSAIVTAAAPDGRVGYAIHASKIGETVQVVVGASGILRGFVQPFAGARIPKGAKIVALLGRATALQRGHSARFEAPIVHSEYKFPALPVGSYSLAIEDVGDSALYVCGVDVGGKLVRDASKEWIEPTTAKVVAGVVTNRDLTIATSACLEGVIRSESGQPLVGASVHCQRLLTSGRVWNQGQICGAPVERSGPATGVLHPSYERSAMSGSDGRYRIASLLPGLYRVTVTLDGRVRRQERLVSLEGSDTSRRDFVLPLAGRVEGSVGHEAVVVLWSEGSQETRAQRTDPNGLFHFEMVAVGAHRIGVVESAVLAQNQMTLHEPPPALARILVEPRKTVFVDLQQDLPVTIHGRLMGREGAVGSALLTLDGNRVETDSDGAFEFRFANPLAGEQRILITRDGVTTGVLLPQAATGVESWRGDLRENRIATQLVALAGGVPVDASVQFWGEAVGRVRLRADQGPRNVGLPVRGVTASVSFANGAFLEQPLTAGGRIEFVAPACGQIHVQALDAQGNALHRQPVRAVTWVDGRPPKPDWGPYDDEAKTVAVEGVTDASGRVTLRGVRAGDVIVHFEATFGSPPGEVQQRVQLDASATVTLQLQRK